MRLRIRDPDTPGGFNDSMAWRPASSSATAEDIMKTAERSSTQISNKRRRGDDASYHYCLDLPLYTSRDQEVTTKYVGNYRDYDLRQSAPLTETAVVTKYDRITSSTHSCR